MNVIIMAGTHDAVRIIEKFQALKILKYSPPQPQSMVQNLQYLQGHMMLYQGDFHLKKLLKS